MLNMTFKRLIQSFLSRFKNVNKRNKLPYATHIPIIVGVSTICKIRRVLELGGGNYSTFTFLNKSIFPELEELITIEDNQEWGNSLALSLKDEYRFKLIFDKGNFETILDKLDLTKFDLIFVDNSTSLDTRAETIQIITNKNVRNAVVLIHDYELKKYQTASRNFRNRYVMDALNPATGLVWMENKNINFRKLNIIKNIISNSEKEISLTNPMDWKILFESVIGW